MVYFDNLHVITHYIDIFQDIFLHLLYGSLASNIATSYHAHVWIAPMLNGYGMRVISNEHQYLIAFVIHYNLVDFWINIIDGDMLRVEPMSGWIYGSFKLGWNSANMVFEIGIKCLMGSICATLALCMIHHVAETLRMMNEPWFVCYI